MKTKPRARNSRNWKVSTPPSEISLFWKITHQHKKSFDRVLDMGSGDGRFSNDGNYNNYLGVEIDKKISPISKNPKTSFVHDCVFEHKKENYSACIGNPPYLRHNEISSRWREKINSRFSETLGIQFDKRSNIYTYFILLGLEKTEPNGLVSLITPYEWAFIPSAKPIRDYISTNNWSVYVYRFNYLFFEGVLTTASISIINKKCSDGVWNYYDIDKNHKITKVNTFTDTGKPALEYEDRGKVWAMRGLSPGTKKVFTLSETERKKLKLTKKDVSPCVTSFRELPKNIKKLDNNSFEKYFVSTDKKCWLIRTDRKLTKPLKKYVQKVPIENRNSWTCLNQKPWYRYKPHPTPKLLMSSAFKKAGPCILRNEINAIAVGSVLGIHTNSNMNIEKLHKKLLGFDFNSRIIPREQGLKKIAIKQVNAVLNYLDERKNGKRKQ